jgi:hypothetical protein
VVVLTGLSSKYKALVTGLTAHASGSRAATLAPETRPPKVRLRLSRDQVAQLVSEYQSGTEIYELAQCWGLHRTTVAAHLRRAGVERRQRGLTEQQLDEAARLYGAEWPLRRLAERYDCDYETVRRGLLGCGVRMRDPSGRD